MESGQVTLLFILLLAAFALTLPFGAWRIRCGRYSLCWFLSIHVPVPFLFLLRSQGGFSWRVIPLFLFATVAGQWAGGLLGRRKAGPGHGADGTP